MSTQSESVCCGRLLGGWPEQLALRGLQGHDVAALQRLEQLQGALTIFRRVFRQIVTYRHRRVSHVGDFRVFWVRSKEMRSVEGAGLTWTKSARNAFFGVFPD